MTGTVTPRQRRNNAWLAGHLGTTTTVGALVFGAMGFAYGLMTQDDTGWLTPPVGAVIGTLAGAMVGSSASLGAQPPTRARRVAISVMTGLLMILVAGMTYLRRTT